MARKGFEALKAGLSTRAASLIRSDPDRAAVAIELGLIDRNWLDDPAEHTVSSAAPMEVMQRFLERSVEQKPSVIGQLGLNALSLMAYDEDAAGEKVPVTICFTDLEGFTAYTDTHGDDAALALLDTHHRKVGPVIRGRGGRVVKRLGDGLLLSFGSSESAMLAALELQDAVFDPLRLRVGVHHGEAVSTPDDLLGHEVNVAARVTDLAKGGQVLATEAALAAAPDLDLLPIAVGSSQLQRLKGVSAPVRVAPIRRSPA